jgi:hypothetical protein
MNRRSFLRCLASSPAVPVAAAVSVMIPPARGVSPSVEWMGGERGPEVIIPNNAMLIHPQEWASVDFGIYEKLKATSFRTTPSGVYRQG